LGVCNEKSVTFGAFRLSLDRNLVRTWLFGDICVLLLVLYIPTNIRRFPVFRVFYSQRLASLNSHIYLRFFSFYIISTRRQNGQRE
jgi:hypothetical protein